MQKFINKIKMEILLQCNLELQLKLNNIINKS